MATDEQKIDARAARDVASVGYANALCGLETNWTRLANLYAVAEGADNGVSLERRDAIVKAAKEIVAEKLKSRETVAKTLAPGLLPPASYRAGDEKPRRFRKS